jgi:hypothetical protein
MEIKNFNTWITESEDLDNGIVNKDHIDKLINDVDFLKRIPKGDLRFEVLKNGQQPPLKFYQIRIMTHGSLYRQINRLLDETGFDVVPDMVGNYITITILIDDILPEGDFKIKQLYDWSERHNMTVLSNPKNYDQLKNVVEKSIEHIFEKIKQVRLIVPSNIRKIEGFSDKIKESVKSLYDGIIDNFIENGSIPNELIDDDILTEIFTKTLHENPQYMEKINGLPPSAKKRIFKSSLDLFKDDNIEINQKTLNGIVAFFKVKKTWGMI